MNLSLKSLHYLSIDVVIGVGINALSVCALLEFKMPRRWYLLLCLAVWWIYLVDRLFDVRGKNFELLPERHQFYLKHFPVISWFAVFLFLVLIFWSHAFLFLSEAIPYSWEILIFGYGMGGIVFLHFLANLLTPKIRWFSQMKELVIAFVYAFGIWGLPLYLSKQLHFLIFPLILFGLALQNLFILSYEDAETDVANGFNSWAQTVGNQGLKTSIRALSLMLFALIATSLFWQKYFYSFVMLLVFVFHLWIEKNPHSWKNERYLVELPFWLPILYLCKKFFE